MKQDIVCRMKVVETGERHSVVTDSLPSCRHVPTSRRHAKGDRTGRPRGSQTGDGRECEQLGRIVYAYRFTDNKFIPAANPNTPLGRLRNWLTAMDDRLAYCEHHDLARADEKRLMKLLDFQQVQCTIIPSNDVSSGVSIKFTLSFRLIMYLPVHPSNRQSVLFVYTRLCSQCSHIRYDPRSV